MLKPVARELGAAPILSPSRNGAQVLRSMTRVQRAANAILDAAGITSIPV